MPRFDYHCPHNGRVVEVEHGANEILGTWGEVCKRAWIKPGETPKEAPVEKLMAAPNVSARLLPSELRNVGMKKWVRRGEGVYEHVTAKDGEPRFIEASEE